MYGSSIWTMSPPAANRSTISSRTARVADGKGVRGAVEVVLGLLRHRERARNGDLRGLAGVRSQELEIANLHRVPARDRACNARHRVRMAAAVERRPGRLDVGPIERGGKPIGVALAAHLPVGDDVQAGALLIADRQQRGVVLGLLEIARIDPPQFGGAHARREALP
jgi:hypothetical protein